MHRSTDAGVTWTRLGGGGECFDIAAGPDGTLYSACQTDGWGLYHSTDSGTTWTLINEGLPTNGLKYPTVNVVAATPTALLCNPTLYGVYRSSDNGANWSPSTSGLAAVNVRDVAAGRDAMFAATEYNGLHRSTDFGATWQNVWSASLSPRVSVVAASGDTIFAATWVQTSTSSQRSPALYRSLNNGQSWSRVREYLTANLVDDIMMDGGEVFVSVEGSLSRSTDNGVSWISADAGITASKINTVASSKGVLFAGTNGGLYRSTNRGTSWKKIGVASGGSNDVLSVVVVEDTILAGTSGGGICRSTDGGLTWTRKDYVTSSIPTMLRAGSAILASTGGFGVLRSIDNGASWQPYNDGLSRIGPVGLALQGGYIFAGFESGSLARRAVESGTVGVDRLAAVGSTMTIHPNPTSGRSVRLQFPATLQGGELRVYSAAGTVVHTEYLGHTDACTLDLRQLPAGVYVVRASGGGDALYTGRLIVL